MHRRSRSRSGVRAEKPITAPEFPATRGRNSGVLDRRIADLSAPALTHGEYGSGMSLAVECRARMDRVFQPALTTFDSGDPILRAGGNLMAIASGRLLLWSPRILGILMSLFVGMF